MCSPTVVESHAAATSEEIHYFQFLSCTQPNRDINNRDHDVHPESRRAESQVMNITFFKLAWTTGGRQFI